MIDLQATSRRELLQAGGAGTLALMMGAGLAQPRTAGAAVRLSGYPFTLGVASGDPHPHRIVLWTRLAPAPLAGGGMPARPVPVRWEVARDAGFRRVVRRGRATALPELGHAVHPEGDGLGADREYFFRFSAAGELSPVGRTRTAPGRHARPGRLRFAFASCQNLQDGFFTAHRHLAEEDVAFVAFLGDYIYESAPSATTLRRHEGTGEPTTLEAYRNRYGQYQSDPGLQAAQAACPWIATLDDHEVDNNWADDIPQDPGRQSPEAFRARRIAAFQAFYEHTPLSLRARPAGPDARFYRRLRFGDLAQLDVLDTRQFRSDQPTTEEGAESAAATITGPRQEAWLTRGLERSPARWNLIAQQVMIAQNDRQAGPGRVFDFDNWDGYRAQRDRLLALFGSGAVANPVVLTGDRHATWVCDLKRDFDDPASPTVGAELTGTSLTSGSDADTAVFHAVFDPVKAESPHWKYIDNQRGYLVCDVTRRRMESELRLVSTVRQEQGTTIRTAARFRTEAGRPGVEVVG